MKWVTWLEAALSRVDPNHPYKQILKTPRNKQSPQKKKNIQWPSFFLSLNPKSKITDPILPFLFVKILTTPPWTLWLRFCLLWLSLSNPSTVSDLGEFKGRSISRWGLRLLLLLLPLLTLLLPLLLLLALPALLLLLELVLLRLKEWARRVIGPEKRGLLTLWETPSLAELWLWWWEWWAIGKRFMDD